MAINTPRRPVVPTKVTPPPAPPTRERIVKRYVASCLYECEFNAREKKQAHGGRESAIVESIRHLRAVHSYNLFIEKQAKRTVQVQRTLIGEELVD